MNIEVTDVRKTSNNAFEKHVHSTWSTPFRSCFFSLFDVVIVAPTDILKALTNEYLCAIKFVTSECRYVVASNVA
jgi:hypothetical protein